MREIKFRAWIKPTQHMLKIDQLRWEGDRLVFEQLEEGKVKSRWYSKIDADGEYDARIMQFTGLHDKNGREIYERDIIKVRHEDGEYDTGEVVYGQKSAAFCVYLPKIGTGIRVPLLNYMTTMGLVADWNCKVIGNIYENPELLK